MPEALEVAEDLLLSWEADEPGYKSFFRFTPGVASSVFFCDFWHLAQTMFLGDRNDIVLGHFGKSN